MRIVDVHAHFYPEAYLTLLQRVVADEHTSWGRAISGLLQSTILPEPRMTNIEAHIEDMDRAGVEVEALSLSLPMTYFEDERDAVEAARIVNDSLAEICARYPRRFKGLASLPLPHAEASVKELDRAINALGLHGVGLGANVHGQHRLDDDRFLPVYREINRHKLTIFLHPAVPPGLEEMLDYNLWVAAGFLMDSTLATLRLVYKGVFEQNPDLNFIVPHLGTFLLSGWERLQGFSRRAEQEGILTKPAGEYLRGLYYDTVNPHAAFWQCAVDTVGIERIVFGTDYPFGARRVAESIQRIERLDIPQSQREAILGGTADRILRA